MAIWTVFLSPFIIYHLHMAKNEKSIILSVHY